MSPEAFFSTFTSLLLPVPKFSGSSSMPPPQAARAIVAASAISARAMRTSALFPVDLLVLVDHHVHVLGLPAEHDAGAAPRQRLAQRLVGVGDEDRHPHSLAVAEEELGCGSQVDRALDHAFDRG